jgi:hypothetical protein
MEDMRVVFAHGIGLLVIHFLATSRAAIKPVTRCFGPVAFLRGIHLGIPQAAFRSPGAGSAAGGRKA